MAGIKGQPSAKPSNVKSPIPDTAPPAFDDFEAPPSFDDFSMGENVPAETAGADQEVPLVDPLSAGGEALQTAADWAPTVGGFAGGMGGFASPVPGGLVGGAALGGAAGNSIKRLIEINLLGKGTDSTLQNEMGGTAMAAVTEGGAQALGGAMGKAAVKLGKWGAQIGGAPIKYVKEAVEAVKETIEKPVLEFIAKNAGPPDPLVAGDTVKQLLGSNIKQKYGKFIEAYGGIDDVAKAVPFTDETRYKFTQKMKAQALDTLGGDDLKIVRKFMDDVDRVGNGAQVANIAMQIGDASRKAYSMNATSRGKILKNLAGEVENFLEDNTTKLASKLRAGGGSPEEMQFLQRIMQQRGIIEPDAKKYASSLAKDYIEGRAKVKSDYAGFREFLSDVGEQVKLKTTNKGPMRFLDDLDSIPSEKLVERMFDPKNARALGNMSRETPEVFEQVKKARLTQLLQKASPDGNLDLKAFRKELNNPKYASTRRFLMSNSEMKALDAAVDNPKLARLEALNSAAENYIVKWANNLGTLMEVTTPRLPTPVKGGAKQAAGKAAMGLGKLFAPEQQSDVQY